jgi:hypothetical protein
MTKKHFLDRVFTEWFSRDPVLVRFLEMNMNLVWIWSIRVKICSMPHSDGVIITLQLCFQKRSGCVVFGIDDYHDMCRVVTATHFILHLIACSCGGVCFNTSCAPDNFHDLKANTIVFVTRIYVIVKFTLLYFIFLIHDLFTIKIKYTKLIPSQFEHHVGCKCKIGCFDGS